MADVGNDYGVIGAFTNHDLSDRGFHSFLSQRLYDLSSFEELLAKYGWKREDPVPVSAGSFRSANGEFHWRYETAILENGRMTGEKRYLYPLAKFVRDPNSTATQWITWTGGHTWDAWPDAGLYKRIRGSVESNKVTRDAEFEMFGNSWFHWDDGSRCYTKIISKEADFIRSFEYNQLTTPYLDGRLINRGKLSYEVYAYCAEYGTFKREDNVGLSEDDQYWWLVTQFRRLYNFCLEIVEEARAANPNDGRLLMVDARTCERWLRRLRGAVIRRSGDDVVKKMMQDAENWCDFEYITELVSNDDVVQK